MMKLLKFEFRKLLRNKFFFILLILIPISAFANAYIINKNCEEHSFFIKPSFYEMILSGISSVGMITFMGAFIGSLACEDDSGKTMKNIVAKGYSKFSIYASKYIISLMCVLLMTAISLLTTYVTSKIYFQANAKPDNFALILFVQIVIVIAYHAVFYAISMTIRKTGVSISINIFLPLVVSVLIAMVEALFDFKDFTLNDYWIDMLLTRLNSPTIKRSEIFRSLYVAIGYLLVLVPGGYLLNRKRDIN